MDKISVIIPTLGKPTLSRCLGSLLTQIRLPDEILVIDNSVDKKAYRIFLNFLGKGEIRFRYFHEKRLGPNYARNLGIKKAVNDTLCFIDDDCVARNSWIKELFTCYFANKKKAIIRGENKLGNPDNLFSCVEYFDEEYFFKKDFFINKDKIRSFWLDSKNFITSKKLLLKNKITFRNYKMGEDLDFSLQANIKNISIIYCSKAQVVHYGKTGLLSHLRREVRKGIEAVKLARYWNQKTGPAIKKVLFNKQIIWEKWFDEKRLKRKLISKLLFNKEIFFKIFFLPLLITNRLINYLFFYIQNTFNFFYE